MEFDVVSMSANESVPVSVLEFINDRRSVICLAKIDACDGRDELERSLSNVERSRAAAFRFETDRDRFVVRRGLLRRLLSLITGDAAAGLLIDAGKFGKPFLVDFPDLHFSVSHSDGLAAFGFSRERRIGVDVETRKRRVNPAAMARTVFSAADVVEIESLVGDAQQTAFFRAWTRLEALTKAIGTGLSDRPDVRLSSPGPSLTVAVGGAKWRIADICIGDDFAGALAWEDGV